MVRVGPNTLLTDDEEFVRKMNAVRSDYSKADWYKAFKMDGNYNNVISMTDHSQHLDLRNRLFNGYLGTGNPNFEGDVDKVVQDVINLISRKYISTGDDIRPYDHSAIMQYFALDVTTSLALCKPFGFVTQDKDMFDYCATMRENFPIMNFLTSYPPLVDFLTIPFIQKNTAPSMKDRTGLGKIKGVAFDIVRERFQQKKDGKETRQDMMDSFIKNGLDETQIADNTLAQLLAGADTTVAVLRTSFVHIISNARIYQRLQAECDQVAKEIPFDEIIPYQRTVQMPYLDACLKEALRHQPAATGTLPRVVPKGGDFFQGKFLPEGTVIGHARWNMSRKNKVYGGDCEIYRPERWLEASEQKLADMNRSHEGLFMTGRHRCLGERIARNELYKMTFEMMRRYHITSLTPMQPIQSNINYGLWMQSGMLLRLEDRHTVNEKV